MALAPYRRRLGTTVFTSDPQSFGEQVMNSPEMVESMRAIAERGLAVAQAAAAEHDRTGAFAASFHATGERGRLIAQGRLSNDDPNAAAIEFGHDHDGRHVPGLHVLGRAVAAMDA